MQTSVNVLSREYPESLTNMDNLAITYMCQERWREAREILLEVVQKRKIVLGIVHRHTVTSMVNLGMSMFHQGLWLEAEE